MAIIFFSLLLGCADKSETSSIIGNPGNGNAITPVVLISISISTTQSTFAVSDTSELSATGNYSDGSVQIITNDVVWFSSNSANISITGSTATALSSGPSNITAVLDGVSSLTSLLAFSATVTSIELNYQNLIIPSDGEVNIEVSAIYDNGQSNLVGSSSTFLSSDNAVATISASGVINAVAAGSANITVDYLGHSKVLALTVNASLTVSIQVSPIIGSKARGAQQQFIVTASLDDGATMDVTDSATWNTSNAGIISINSSGLADLIGNGSVSITANYQGLSNSVNFTVLDKTLDSISLSLVATTISAGVMGQVNATANYSDGSTEDITSITNFSVDDSSIAIVSNGVDEQGRINSLAAGAVSITGDYNGETSSILLTVSNSNLVSITVQTGNSLLSQGINAYFTAIGIYDDGSNVDITNNVTWSVSNASYGSISNGNSNKGLYFNTFVGGSTSSLTISADLGGTTGSLDILLAPGSISSISINPSSAIMNENMNTDFKAFAHFSDGASVEITNIATWVSSDVGIAVVSNGKIDAGRVSSLSEGLANVEVQYNGLTSSQSTINVDNGQAPETPDEGTGLLASYYTGNNFDTLMGQRIDSTLDFNWSTGQAPLGVGDNFSVRWTGQIKGHYTGDCQVSSRSDDGFRVYIDGALIIDVWFPHAPRWDHNYTVPFVEGVKQDITVEFFENGGHAVAELYWECPGDAGLEVVPTQSLFPL